MLESLAALPDDVRAIVVERVLAELRQRGEPTETFEPAPGVSPERAPLNDITATDRSRVIVFSMLDGEPHEILRIDRPRVLALRMPDGKPAFWSPGMPGRPPRRVVGTIMCRLHPDSPERAQVDALGFAGRYCNDGDRRMQPRADFKNVIDRDNHEERKHAGFTAVWRRFKDDSRAEESLAAQREMAAAMRALAERTAGEYSQTPASEPARQSRTRLAAQAAVNAEPVPPAEPDPLDI